MTRLCIFCTTLFSNNNIKIVIQIHAFQFYQKLLFNYFFKHHDKKAIIKLFERLIIWKVAGSNKIHQINFMINQCSQEGLILAKLIAIDPKYILEGNIIIVLKIILVHPKFEIFFGPLSNCYLFQIAKSIIVSIASCYCFFSSFL